MPGQNNQNTAPSPFEIVTPGKSKKGGNRGLFITVAIVVFLLLSVIAGVLLVRQQQNIQEKAQALCPAAQACPASDATHLLNCTPAEADGTPDDQLCYGPGVIGSCGGTQFCCPAAGAAWTSNMSACATPTPSPSLSPTPSAAPNTCNGTCGSDSNCQSGLICSGGFCRNPLCTSSAECTCGSATPTPTASATATPAATQSAQSSPLPIPVTGTDWPTIAGMGIGVAAILISILIAL